jgi:hypothetical protein
MGCGSGDGLEKIASEPIHNVILRENYKLIADGLNYLFVKPIYFIGRETKYFAKDWFHFMFLEP